MFIEYLLYGIKIGKSLVCGSNNLSRQNEGEKASTFRAGPGLGFSPLPTPHLTAERWRHRKGNHSWFALRVSGRACLPHDHHSASQRHWVKGHREVTSIESLGKAPERGKPLNGKMS